MGSGCLCEAWTPPILRARQAQEETLSFTSPVFWNRVHSRQPKHGTVLERVQREFHGNPEQARGFHRLKPTRGSGFLETPTIPQ